MRALRTPLWILVLLFVTFSICQAKTTYAYVANNSVGTVSVVNISNNTVVKTITVGTFPYGVAVDQPGKFVYVTNSGSNSVSVISTATNAVVATIPVTSPMDLALSPNGKVAYVSSGSGLAVINTATKKVTTTIPVTNPIGVAVNPIGTFVYVVSSSAGNVLAISTLTNSVVATIPVGTDIPIGVVISPDGSTAYVTGANNHNVTVIQTANNSVVTTINVASGPFHEGISPDGHWLYVLHYNAGGGTLVSVIDTSTWTVATTIVVGTGPQGVSFTQDSAFAYVSNITSNNVSVINTASRTVVDTITGNSAPAGVGVMGLMKVSTVAGGFVGDKLKATNAALGAPYSSVLDGAGNLYISDIAMHRIRKVDTSGNITTYAGTGICGYNGENVKASKAMVCGPNGIVLDSSGNVAFADGSNSRIRKVDHKSGLITTIAGNGVFGYDPSQDGGPALNAAIGQPFQIAYDAAGNLFFDQVGNCVVRKVDTSGTITTVAGTGTCGYNGDGIPAKTAQLMFPRGVAFDNKGNLYIGDTQNHRVRKVDSSGTITTFAGTGHGGFTCNGGPATSANIGNPRGLTIFNDALYIGNGGAIMCSVDLTSNNINTYAGSFLGYDGDGHSLTSSEFYTPTHVVFDGSGNPLFNDDFNGRVRRATGGILSTYAGGYVGEGVKATSGTFEYAEALAVDKAGNLYIADETGNRIRKVSDGKISTIAGSLNGISGYSGDSGPAVGALLNQPQGVAVDSAGNVYIADTYNGVVREVSSGNIKTLATNANFNYLAQMAVDSSNNLYVADEGACVIWKITTPGGTVSVAAGVVNTCGYNGDGIGATSAQLNVPYGVAFDSSGNMVIADNGNSRVREVNTSGTISTVVGNGTFGYTGDGGSATAAEVTPNSVAVDKSGTIYIADFNFDRIRKVSGGIITTFAGAGYGFNGDGLWPLYTTFDDPIAIAVDLKGTVYELDDSDHRVRSIK